jgi:hypothetical protein
MHERPALFADRAVEPGRWRRAVESPVPELGPNSWKPGPGRPSALRRVAGDFSADHEFTKCLARLRGPLAALAALAVDDSVLSLELR